MAFETSKQLLLSSQVLVHFNLTREIILYCDTSAYGIGTVLAHRMSNILEKPIGFVSCTLTAAEKNYLQIKKEALSCISGINKFHAYLYGHKFTLSLITSRYRVCSRERKQFHNGVWTNTMLGITLSWI